MRRLALVASLALLALRAAEPTDLSDYKSPATCRTTSIRIAPLLGNRQPGYLGVGVDRDPGGKLLVNDVQPGSPAERGGIKTGDHLMSVGGQAISNVDALRDALQGKPAGERVTLALQREGKPLEVTAILAAPSAPMAAPSRPVIGVSFAEEGSVKLRQVSPNSPASRAGMKAGDVLVKLDQTEISSSEALRDLLSSYTPGQKVKVGYVRDGKEQIVELELAAAEEPNPALDMPSLARWDTRRTGLFRKPQYNLAVIVVAFPDLKANEKITDEAWDNALFSTGKYKDKSATGQPVYGSMNDYYQEISCGKFSVAGKTFKPVEVKKKRADYTQTANRNALLTEAIDALLERDGKDALKPFDGLFFVYCGNRVQTQRGGIYWPHRASMNHQGKRWAYFICPEGGDRMSSISVISHEFGHMLGLPDLYAKPEDPGSEGVGVWCTMSTGHGRDGKPLHFSAWCKEQLGWLTPAVIDPGVKQKLILAPIEGQAGECFKVLLRPDGSEYLLLENRVHKGYDKDLPGEGLLIWRVVDGKPVLEESHGISGPDGPQRFLGAVPFPSKSNTAFTPVTTPTSRSQKPGASPVHITNIRRQSDGKISFWIGYEYL